MKVKVEVSLMSCLRAVELEIDDACTEKDIERLAREEAWSMIELTWERVP